MSPKVCVSRTLIALSLALAWPSLSIAQQRGQGGQTPQSNPQTPPMQMPMPAGQTDPQPAQPAAPQTLEERIKELEQRVSELETTTVLSEPETRVRRVEIWVDKDGNVYDHPMDGARRTFTYQRERVYRRQTINEKIEEALEEAESRNVKVGVSAAIAPQFAIRTKGPASAADGHAFALASADLYFTAGLAQNTVFFADVVGLSGSAPDGEIGGLTLLNGYAARLVRQNDLSLREAWLMTDLFSKTLSISVGRLDLTNYFDHNAVANDETSQFISDALVNNPMLGLSTNGAGAAVVFDPKIGLNFKIGAQQSNTDATNLSDSMFSLAEVGYLATPLSLGEGNYRFWYRVDNSSQRNRTGYGLSFDQRLLPTTTVFGRFGRAQADQGRDLFYSAGLQFQRGLVFNPSDTWGIGYAQVQLGAGQREHLKEGYYSFNLTERLQLSLHLTHVLETRLGEDGTGKLGYFVPGVRLNANF